VYILFVVYDPIHTYLCISGFGGCVYQCDHEECWTCLIIRFYNNNDNFFLLLLLLLDLRILCRLLYRGHTNLCRLNGK
jgi:hypothetical protein